MPPVSFPGNFDREQHNKNLTIREKITFQNGIVVDHLSGWQDLDPVFKQDGLFFHFLVEPSFNTCFILNFLRK